MRSKNALDLLMHFVLLQERLCTVSVASYPTMIPACVGLPRRGAINLDGEEWMFQRHGAGFAFTSAATGELIDAHDDFEPPFSTFDPWRLTLFFESRKIDGVVFQREIFPVLEEKDVERLLASVERTGLICRERERWFVLAPAARE